MRRTISFILIILLLGFFSCKVFEPDTESVDASPDVKTASPKDLFEIDSYSIYFDGVAPANIEGYIEFSEPMNTSSFESNFYIYPITATDVLGTAISNIEFNWRYEKTRVEFRTGNTYDDNVSYLLKISKSAKDHDGNGPYGYYSNSAVGRYTATDWYYHWSPGTYFGYDRYRPECYLILAVNDGSSGGDEDNIGNVGINEYFRVYFDEDVIVSEVSIDNISFTPSADFTVTVDTADTRFDITPNSSLDLNTDYTIEIDLDDIHDDMGNSAYDNNSDGDDNIFKVKFNTYETLADTLRYSSYSWINNDEEVRLYFDTPNTDNDYLDHSTISYKTVYVTDEEYTVWAEDSITDERTYIIIKGDDINQEYVYLSYKIADIDGNTLDGNGNNRLEGDHRDDYRFWLP